MRLSSLKLSIALAALPLLAQQAPRPAIVSPEVQADRRVTFRLLAPKANEVELSGDWMGAQPPAPLVKDEGGVWRVTLGRSNPTSIRMDS